VTGPTSVEEVRTLARRGRRLKFVLFWKPRLRGEPVSAAVLSQWERSPFTLDGRRFPTVEHYLMWRKAVLFDDGAVADRILDAPGPAAVKALGRQVRGFDPQVWERDRVGISVAGNVAKFRQNPELGDYLVGTGSRILVEASPADRIWGIGLEADDPGAEKPDRWRGRNLLGFALMRARNEILDPDG